MYHIPPEKSCVWYLHFPFYFVCLCPGAVGPVKHTRKRPRGGPQKIKQITKQREDAKYIVWILYSIFNWSCILHPTWRRRTNQKSSGKKKLLNVKIVTCRCCVVYGGPHTKLFSTKPYNIYFIYLNSKKLTTTCAVLERKTPCSCFSSFPLWYYFLCREIQIL